MDRWGVHRSLPTLLVTPLVRAFILNPMSTTIIANNVVNNDHHREITINAAPEQAAEILKAALAEDITPDYIPDQDLFKYIHVAVTDRQERVRIHKMVCNIVQLPKLKMICDELYRLIKQEKVLATIKPEAMLAELRRLGMPAADVQGFSDQNFYSNYRV